jgi:putative membrane protein
MSPRRLIPALLVVYAVITAYLQYSIGVLQSTPAMLTPIVTLLGFSIALIHSSERLNWKSTLWLLASAFVVSLTFESVGVLTGLVYGPYHYTTKLGYLFLGLVPLIIPVAWFMMMYPSLVVADWLIPAQARSRTLLVAAAGAILMTAWDVVMDPMMVKGGNWVWDVNGAYFGIPLQNFFGWWLTTLVTFLVFFWLAKPNFPRTTNAAFDRQAIVLYAITALGSISGALLTGLGGAALAGFFAIVPWMIFGWMQMKN